MNVIVCFVLWQLRATLLPGDGHLPCPHDFLDPDGPEQLDKSLKLLFISGDHEGIRLDRRINNTGAEDICKDRKSVV